MSAKKKKKKKRFKIIIFIIEIIILLAVLAVLFLWSKFQRIERGPDIDTDDVVNTDIAESTQEVMKGYTNIALFALDNRTNGSYASGNSDVIMVASINNDTQEIKLASVYRDTFLNVNDDGSFNFRKANYAYNKGGVEASVRMLNRNLDLDITDYVVVDFQAVTEAVDLLGGVEIEVDEQEVKYINPYIQETSAITGHASQEITQPGVYNLDGVQATSYCRIRYTAGSDFRRAQRQREVLTQMAKKAKASDLLTINKIIDSVLDDINTDLTETEMLSMASQLMNYELVDTTGFPFKLCNVNLGDKKGDCVIPCDLVTNVIELHKYLFNDYSYTPSNTVQSYSEAIVQETGKGIGDEEATGVSEDNYADSSKAQAEDDTASQ